MISGDQLAAGASDRRPVAPRLRAVVFLERISGGIDRREADHIGGQTRIPVKQIGLSRSLFQERRDGVHWDPGASKHDLAAHDLGIVVHYLAGAPQSDIIDHYANVSAVPRPLAAPINNRGPT
jgi:hypothetical protein